MCTVIAHVHKSKAIAVQWEFPAQILSALQYSLEISFLPSSPMTVN